MELKPLFILALFALLTIALLIQGEDPIDDGSVQGVWRGRLSTVTAGGGMLEADRGTFWVSSDELALKALRGDSMIVLGIRRGRFISPLSIRLKPSITFFSRIRRNFMQLLVERIADERARGLAGGLLMGLRGMITEETSRVFRNSGTSHLLALSGLHTALVAALLTAGAGFCFGKRPAAFWAASAGVVVFVVLSGGRASTVRAGIMSVAVILWMCYRGGKIHLLTVWWLALGISLALIPGTLHDRGAQMSYGAVLALILMGKNISGRFSFVLSPLYAGVVVTVALAPLTTAVYGGFAWLGPTATVLSLPFITGTMILGLITAAGGSFAEPVLVFLSSVWHGMLGLMGHEQLCLDQTKLWPLWIVLTVALRVISKFNGFHRRFR